MKKSIFVHSPFLLIVMLLCSCTTKSTSNNEEVEIIETPFKDDKEHILNMSEIVDSIQYIRLETTVDNIIGEIGKLVLLKDRMMIVDKKISHSISFFNMQGKFLNQVSNRGAGPEEYLKIGSVTVDEKGKRMFVLDIKQKKVLMYTMEGEYLDSFSHGFFCREIEYINNDVLACYCDYYSGDDKIVKEGKTPLLMLYDLKSHDCKPFFYEDTSIEGSETIMVHMLSKYNTDTASLTYPLNNFIYAINGHTAKAKYQVNFGEKNESLLKTYVDRLRNENISVEQIGYGNANPDFYQLTGSMLGSDLLCFGYRNFKAQVNGMFFYCLKSKKYVGGQSSERYPIQNDIDHGFPLIPYAIKENQIYTIIDTGYLEQLNTTSPVLKQYQQTMTSDDNPVIMISTMKIK